MRNNTDKDWCPDEDWARYGAPNAKSKDLQVQLALSLILGISAFVTFCVRTANCCPTNLLPASG